MNNMKQKIHNKFTTLGGKLRLDKSGDSDSLALPSYAETLYMSSKNDREVYSELYKKMSTICVQNYFVADDKKMKKNTWESLSGVLLESEKKLSDDALTKEILYSSTKVLDELSRNAREFEKVLSLNVIKHFQDLSEDNSLSNTKKTLTSLSKEVKISSEKVQILQDQLNIQPSETNRKSADISSIGSTENKLLSAQMIEENTEKEWDNKKDFYLTKLFVAEAEKFSTAEKILEFFEHYLDYYSECQKILSKSIPEIKASLDKNKHIYAFHDPLEEHLSATNRKLSYVLETCIQELDNEDTLQHEGLFRISGGKSKMELLKSALNVGRADEFIVKGCDSSVFAGVLKQYLRELPIPLMTHDLYDRWCEVGIKIRQNDIDSAMSLTKDCLSEMPVSYYENLVYLMQFLSKISAHESSNKMSASNLGLMLGPNLIRSKNTSNNDENEASVMMVLGSPGGSVLEFMIARFSELFPDAPVYPTAPSMSTKGSDISTKVPDMSTKVSDISTKVPDMSTNVIINERDFEKKAKKLKPVSDNDSVTPGDMIIEEGTSNANCVINDTLRIDQTLKSPRDAPVKPHSFRKAPAPPPPPQNKPYIVEDESETCKELISLRSEPRPTVKKRISKLDKSSSDMNKEPEEFLTENEGRRAVSTIISQRHLQPPSVPTKKPNVIPQSESLDRPSRPENPPPKRPNNPPPPIPPFEKLKENLDQKQSSAKIEPRKQSLHDESLSASIDSDSGSSINATGKHQYSISDVTKTSF